MRGEDTRNVCLSARAEMPLPTTQAAFVVDTNPQTPLDRVPVFKPKCVARWVRVYGFPRVRWMEAGSPVAVYQLVRRGGPSEFACLRDSADRLSRDRRR